ncbi:MAG: septal ring lytic transglycosylase RlpA family protein [Hydrotalea sp.]|nr:septal ring lytic transglycosylase RlpA family protein [Hydrotalea sp.]MDI9314482.1 septal ring lytic transglycosylase RlpA family protein [Hydrotalea sp.]
MILKNSFYSNRWRLTPRRVAFGLAICMLCLRPMVKPMVGYAQDNNSNGVTSAQVDTATGEGNDDKTTDNAGDVQNPSPTLKQKIDAQFGMEFNPARGNFVPPFNDRTAPFFGKPKVGNPYAIEGQEFRPFFPRTDYVESGMASWYGDDFHGKDTANGGQFNMGLVSAAHRTLPLPAVAVIVNLRTGAAIKLVINDRGPFAKNRILDMSKQAANLIGYYGVGTAPVKVIFLRQETLALWQKMGFAVSQR